MFTDVELNEVRGALLLKDTAQHLRRLLCDLVKVKYSYIL